MNTIEGKGGEFSPEKLHGMIIMLYSQIPEFIIGDSIIERIDRRKRSELTPIIIKRFEELISASPTTKSYKEMMSVLTRSIVVSGRDGRLTDPIARTQVRDIETDSNFAFFTSLNLDSDDASGIFSTAGAKRAERKLYDWCSNVFGETVGNEIRYGRDPFTKEVMDGTAYSSFSLKSLRDFMLNWWKEFINLNGEPIKEFKSELRGLGVFPRRGKQA